MTFNFAPWAIDGARTAAGLARLASYAGGGGRSGVIRPGDLKVTALAVPGQGLRISSGGAYVLNDYLTSPDESYVISNPASHTVLAASMPSSQPTTTRYLVCVVVGDPEFDQTGHPFMPAGDLDPIVALTYEYVRVVVLPCSSTDDHFDDLNKNYPGIALARLEVPANTTTITNAMITDVRELARPRSEQTLLSGRPTSVQQPLNTTTSPGSAWYEWVDFRPSITIPKWATHIQILTHITGIGNSGEAVAEARTVAGAAAGPVETIDVDAAAGRHGIMTVFEQNISAIAGTTIQLKIQGRQLFDLPGYVFVDERTQVVFDVRFTEDIV